jgi:hypothetical protein
MKKSFKTYFGKSHLEEKQHPLRGNELQINETKDFEKIFFNK